jgi:hypothetical protein
MRKKPQGYNAISVANVLAGEIAKSAAIWVFCLTR